MKIRDLNISARSRSCLLNAGYTDVENLKDIDDDTLLNIRNLNQACAAEIRTAIDKYFSVDDELSETKMLESLTNDNINFTDPSSSSYKSTNNEYNSVVDSHTDVEVHNLDDLGLSISTVNFLHRSGIFTVNELCDKFDTLNKRRNGELPINKKKLAEITHKLKELGIELDANGEVETHSEEETSYAKDLNAGINEIGLPSKICLCLQNAGIYTLEDLCNKTYDDMFSIPNLGYKSLDKITTKMKDLGVQFRSLPSPDNRSICFDDAQSDEPVTESYPKEHMSSDIDMNTILDNIALSTESCNFLNKAGINTLGDLCNRSLNDVLFIPNLSHKNMDEILSRVNELGVQFKKIPEAQHYSAQYTFCDSADLSTLIKSLKLSFKTKLYFRRNGIDTVKELCSMSESDFDLSLNLEQYKEEIVSQMNLIGVYFRPEKETSCLYLYPSHVKKIAYEKRAGWEYRLFIEAALINYNWLSQFRDQTLNLWEYEDEDERIDSADKLSQLITEKNSEISSYTQEIDDCMEKDIFEALDLQGNPGNIDQIICATEKLFNIYKSIIKSRFSFSAIDASNKYRNSISLLCDIYEECLCNIFDVLYQKLLIVKKQIDNMIDGLISYKDISTDLNVPIVLNVSKISKALDDITEDTTSTFKHISILDSDAFRIDFCGFHLEKDKHNDSTTDIMIKIWFFNHSDEAKKILLNNLFVNGRAVNINEYLNTEGFGNHGYHYIEMGYFYDNTLIIDDESCEDSSELQFTIEIDDTDDHALAFSQTITVDIEPKTKDIKVISIEDFLSSYSLESCKSTTVNSNENSNDDNYIFSLPHIGSFHSR